jgi:hypothetical protein
VDQDGHVLDLLVSWRRDKLAAKKFFRKLLKGLTYVPRAYRPWTLWGSEPGSHLTAEVVVQACLDLSGPLCRDAFGRIEARHLMAGNR